jgi:hypothetical protein
VRAGDLVAQVPAGVGVHERRELVERQVRLLPDVAELEGGVPVAAVLVVDHPEPLAVVDEVRGEQVVVAGHRGALPDRQRGGDPVRVRHQLEVPVRQPEAPLLDDPEVAALHREHVEVPGEPRPGVQRPADRRDPLEHRSLAQVVRRKGPALDPGDDQRVVLRQVPEHLRRRAALGSPSRVDVLGVAVDREQVAVGAGEPDDDGAFRGGDLEVHVGQPAGQCLDLACAGQRGHVVQDGVQPGDHVRRRRRLVVVAGGRHGSRTYRARVLTV